MSDMIFFISSGNGGSRLEDVAAGVIRALGLSQSEERESENYPPDDHYFVGFVQNACVQVYDADDDQKPEFPFRVSIENPWRSGVGTAETDSKRMASLLASAGFSVFIPNGDWDSTGWDGEGEVYAA